MMQTLHENGSFQSAELESDNVPLYIKSTT